MAHIPDSPPESCFEGWLPGSPDKALHKFPIKATATRGIQVLPDELVQISSKDRSTTGEPLPLLGLSELLKVIRAEHDQDQRRIGAEHKLLQSQIATARACRLLSVVPAVQRKLADCIRFDNKSNFARLCDAVRDCFASSLSLSQVTTDQGPHQEPDDLAIPASFIDALPDEIKDFVLTFLGKVRYDSHFLHHCLASLSYQKLTAILPDKSPHKSTKSIFGSSDRYGLSVSRHLDPVTQDQLALLARSGFGSPLETLIHSLRSPSTLSLKDDSTATDVWATVCAKMIVEQRPGSEKFVPAIIDIWASASQWIGKDRLELWILEILKGGAFLVKRSHRPTNQTFKMHVQSHQEGQSKDVAAGELFYTKAVESLLDLLGETDGPTIIPEGARKMCASICAKLSSSPGYQHAFPSFIGTRWLVPSFLPDALTLPEMHGIVGDSYIGHNARQTILREVMTRAQKALLDSIYSWKLGTRPSSEMTYRVTTVLNKFGLDSAVQATAHEAHRSYDKRGIRPDSPDFVALSANDVVTIINSLYPQRRPASVMSGDSGQSSLGLRSSASSLSGFSLFKNGADPPQSTGETTLETQDKLDPNPSGAETLHTTTGCFMAADELAGRIDLNEQQLREACGFIEGFNVTRSETTVSHWAVLILGVDGKFQSIRDEFSKVADPCEKPIRDQRIRPSIYSESKVAFKDLLEASQEDRYREGILASRLAHSDGIYSCAHVSDAFEACKQLAEEQSDFLIAREWSKCSLTFGILAGQDRAAESLASIVGEIAHEAEDSQYRSRKLADKCENWLAGLRPTLDNCLATLAERDTYIQLLRSKMWYVADVRSSSAYDEARSIASALSTMGQTPPRHGQATVSRVWGNTKPNPTELYLKTEAQVVELLSAKTRHGGPNKLSDDQIRALSNWMAKNRIEKICKGEERIHKLCMDIQKCIDTLLADLPQEIAALWSNDLFKRDAKFRGERKQTQSSTLRPNHSISSLRGIGAQQSNKSVDKLSIRSQTLSVGSSKDYFSSHSPTWTVKSSAPFWSPAVTDTRTSSSATSIAPSHAKSTISRGKRGMRPSATFKINEEQSLEELLRQHLTTLLLSDLAGSSFSDGSETDRSYWTGLGGHFADKHFRTIVSSTSRDAGNDAAGTRFEYRKAFQTLLRCFAMSWSPFTKMKYIHEIDALLQLQTKDSKSIGLSSNEEPAPSPQAISGKFAVAPDNAIGGFRRLFADRSIRPPHIFRDLQFIAALVPAGTLDSTLQGRSFWNAVVAITALQQEARKVMVETADTIIAYHANNRGYNEPTSTTSSPAQEQRDTAAFTAPAARSSPSAEKENIAKYGMGDAGTLLQIAAKEGDPVAQRELATLYLTHPELMPRIIAPFAPPRSVFTEELEAKWRRNQDPQRCDPATMCVAHHWMVLSSRGGDSLAKEYLRQGEEIEKLP